MLVPIEERNDTRRDRQLKRQNPVNAACCFWRKRKCASRSALSYNSEQDVSTRCPRALGMIDGRPYLHAHQMHSPIKVVRESRDKNSLMASFSFRDCCGDRLVADGVFTVTFSSLGLAPHAALVTLPPRRGKLALRRSWRPKSAWAPLKKKLLIARGKTRPKRRFIIFRTSEIARCPMLFCSSRQERESEERESDDDDDEDKNEQKDR